MSDMSQPHSYWEWLTAALAAVFAVFAALAGWLKAKDKTNDGDTDKHTAQLDRIEESINALCRALMVPNEDGYPVSSSRKLADRLEKRLIDIEAKIDKRAKTRPAV